MKLDGFLFFGEIPGGLGMMLDFAEDYMLDEDKL